MKRLKKAKWMFIVSSALTIILGVLIMIWPGISALTLCYVLGAVVTLIGIMRIVSYFKRSMFGLPLGSNLAMGLMNLVLGVMLLCFADAAVLWMPVAVGIMVILESMFILETSIDAKRAGVPNWWLSLLLAIVSAAAGVILILNPFTGAFALMLTLGITLIAEGINNLCSLACVSRFVKDNVEVTSFFDEV